MPQEHDTLTQKELEAPVKGYQLQSVKDELTGIKTLLNEIKDQTKGVITFEVMEKYVDKRIEEKTEHLVTHKKNTSRLGWAILLLIIGDIMARVLSAS